MSGVHLPPLLLLLLAAAASGCAQLLPAARTAALDAWESRKSLYRWGNTILIPLAFAGFGVIRWQMRARKKASQYGWDSVIGEIEALYARVIASRRGDA